MSLPPAVFGDERVERVARLEIREIRPRAEDAQGAQFAAVFVRDDVVGIVGARAVEQKVAEDLAGNQAAGDDAVGAVRIAGGGFEDRVEIVPREWRLLAGRPLHLGRRIDRRQLRIERGDERFHLVVAERPEELRRDRHRGGRAFRLVFGSSSMNQVSPRASRALNPGWTPDVFSPINTQCDGSGGAPAIGPRAISIRRDPRLSGLIGPIRFVNQLESGTSSIELMSRARVPDGLWPAVTNRLYVISYIDWISYGFAPFAFCDSGSRAIGSSG